MYSTLLLICFKCFCCERSFSNMAARGRERGIATIARLQIYNYFFFFQNQIKQLRSLKKQTLLGEGERALCQPVCVCVCVVLYFNVVNLSFKSKINNRLLTKMPFKLLEAATFLYFPTEAIN